MSSLPLQLYSAETFPKILVDSPKNKETKLNESSEIFPTFLSLRKVLQDSNAVINEFQF